jgi:DNA-binding HxlR family transcriptional regulator
MQPEPSMNLVGSMEDRDGWSAETCSLSAALEVVGRRATMLLLREAFYGAHRFHQFVRRTGFAEPVAASRLRELVNAGLLERRPYKEPGQRSRSEYYLTQKGSDLFASVVALTRWGDKWAQQDSGGPVILTHGDCGAQIDVEVRCASGHFVAAHEVEADLRLGEADRPKRRND